jgi:chloride channel 3/4/5
MYALLGAISSLGGTTKLTVSLTIIMFELTGSVIFHITGRLDNVVPCMITVIISKFVGDLFVHGGLADVMIKENDLPFLNPHENVVLGSQTDVHMVHLFNY